MRIGLRQATTRAAALALSLLLLTPTTPASAATPAIPATPADRYAAIDEFVRDRMKATKTPGLAYAVVGPNGPLHQRTWGTDGRGERVTAHTPFLWGSVAKPIAATSVMVLVQDRQLSLDDRVMDHLPDFRFGGQTHASKVTVRHLLNQTAGIPESATFKVADHHASDSPRPAERVRDLDDVKPLGPPGTKYAYSSSNYLALAGVVESVTKRPFSDHLRRTVLDPARMDGAIVDQSSARERDLPPGHQLLWGTPRAVADGVDDHGAAYGYTGGDLNDLMAFASLQLRAGKPGQEAAVLTPESVQLMREDTTLQPTEPAAGATSGTGTGYGLGWRVGGLDAPLDKAVWHTGATPGYSAMLFLLPEQNVALVVEQNLHGLLHDEAVMQVGFGAARILAGGDGSPTGPASAASYHQTVWGVTALAAALLVAVGRSVLLLRRPATPGTPPRRIGLTALWCLTGALPVAALVYLDDVMSLGQLRTWAPDVFVAACVAATAGATTLLLRLTLAVRSRRFARSASASPGG